MAENTNVFSNDFVTFKVPETRFSADEWDLVESFIAHNYRILWEKGLIA